MQASKEQAILNQAIRNSRILIVDDAATDRLILHSYCSKAGFSSVDEVTNGQEALAYIRRSPPDLMFLDVEMPVMDGITLCRTLRAENLLHGMVVIMQTVSNKIELKAQAFEAGVTDLITKPLHSRETIARALAHLERRYLYKQSLETYARLQEEMEEAVVLQSILLPQDAVVEAIARDMQIDIAHYYHPASQLAGDYISVRRLGPDRVALISIDICGHGLTAALYAFSVHSLLESVMLESMTPAQALMQLNAKLCNFMAVGKFATGFIAIMDRSQKQIHYAAAASPPPIFLSGGKATLLETRGHVLGVDEGVHYENHHLSYQPGDVLMLYSDALVESPNAKGSMVQPEDLAALVIAGNGATAGAHLRHVIAAFYDDKTRQVSDDLSMIICKF